MLPRGLVIRPRGQPLDRGHPIRPHHPNLAEERTGVANQLSGGAAGPDGIEMDAENGLLVCHLGIGVWGFDANMLPTHLVHADGPHHHHLDHCVFGGPDRQPLYITEALSGDILMVRIPVAGKLMYGLQ